MKMSLDDGGAQAVYDFWLGLIPQFLGQFGVSLPAGKASGAQVPGKAAPTDWFSQWSAVMPSLTNGLPKSAADAAGQAAQAAQSMFAPWAAMMAPYPSGAAKTGSGVPHPPGPMDMFSPWLTAMPFVQATQGAAGSDAIAAAMQPVQAAQQAWLDMVAADGFHFPAELPDRIRSDVRRPVRCARLRADAQIADRLPGTRHGKPCAERITRVLCHARAGCVYDRAGTTDAAAWNNGRCRRARRQRARVAEAVGGEHRGGGARGAAIGTGTGGDRGAVARGCVAPAPAPDMSLPSSRIRSTWRRVANSTRSTRRSTNSSANSAHCGHLRPG